MRKELTRELISQKVKTDNIETIKHLNLWGNNLDDISLISEMPSLEIVSFSVNNISSLRPFSTLTNLRELYLRRNLISNLNEIKYLSDCEKLQVLWLSENPICDNQDYRSVILCVLPQLERLDDISITKYEREKAKKKISGRGSIEEDEDEEDDDIDNENINNNISNNNNQTTEDKSNKDKQNEENESLININKENNNNINIKNENNNIEENENNNNTGVNENNNNEVNDIEYEDIYDIGIEFVPYYEKDSEEFEINKENNEIALISLFNIEKKENNELEIKCVLQKLKKHNYLFELKDIYDGAGNNGKCVICYTNNRNTIFLPCRHSCCCQNCSGTLMPKICPLCKENIKDIICLYKDLDRNNPNENDNDNDNNEENENENEENDKINNENGPTQSINES